MLQKLIRVVLTANVDQFTGGMRRALQSFRSFTGSIGDGIGSAMAAFGNLQGTLFFLMNNLRALGDLARGVFDAFIGGAVSAERQEAAFRAITGSGEQAAEMMQFLEDMATRTGVSFEGLLPSAQQAAVGLRSINGEVDLDQWAQMVELVTRFQTLRPDVPVQLWGRAISSFMAGDPSTLTRLLDVNVRDIQNLTEEAQRFLEAGQGATEQQLGDVTRLGEGATQQAGDALSVLEEVAQAVGATEELIASQADTTSGRMAIITARFEELKREVGEELLPIFNELLELILKIFDEHGEDIERFIDKFGDFTADQWVELADALNNIDWEKIARVVNDMLAFLNGTGAVFGDSPFFQFLERTFNPESGTLGGVQDVTGVTQGGGGGGGLLNPDNPIVDFFSNLLGGGGNGGGAGVGGSNQQEVIITINPSDLLEAEIDRRSNAQSVRAMDEFIEGLQADNRTNTIGGA